MFKVPQLLSLFFFYFITYLKVSTLKKYTNPDRQKMEAEWHLSLKDSKPLVDRRTYIHCASFLVGVHFNLLRRSTFQPLRIGLQSITINKCFLGVSYVFIT